MPSPTAVAIELADEERVALQAWTRRRTSAAALSQRARIVLGCAAGQSNTEVARRLGVHRNTVALWRGRFVEFRLDGLLDEARPGQPRKITDAKVEEVITKTLESAPRDATHWSTRSMAAEVGLNQTAVARIWRAFGLQPHRTETWKLSKDPLFVDKVRDVVGLYLNPPERAVVLCVDEKSQIQALDRTAPILPMRPGVPERQTHDYKRHGTSSLYAALDLSTGKVIGALHSRHRAIEFKKFLADVKPSDFEREFFQGCSGNRDRRQQLGVAIALDHLGRNVRRFKSQLRANSLFHIGRKMRERADSAADLPHRNCLTRTH